MRSPPAKRVLGCKLVHRDGTAHMVAAAEAETAVARANTGAVVAVEMLAGSGGVW